MFWDSVTGGLKMFAYWQTYAAAIEYLLLFIIPMGVFGILMKSGNRAAAGVGCLSVVLTPLLQVAAQVVFILTLWPIIFGFADSAAWAFPFQLISQEPRAFAKLVGILAVAAIVLAFIPFLGQIQSLHTLVLGGLALSFLIAILESAYPGAVAHKVNYWPGFWFVAGLLVIGTVVSWIGMLVAAAAATALEGVAEGWGQLVMFPVAAVFGFIPVFMYGAWLGVQLKAVH